MDAIEFMDTFIKDRDQEAYGNNDNRKRCRDVQQSAVPENDPVNYKRHHDE